MNDLSVGAVVAREFAEAEARRARHPQGDFAAYRLEAMNGAAGS